MTLRGITLRAHICLNRFRPCKRLAHLCTSESPARWRSRRWTTSLHRWRHCWARRLQIQQTDENPPRVSFIDVIAAFLGKNQDHVSKYLRCIIERYGEGQTNCPDFRFCGRGPRDTPVAGVRGIVNIILLLPSQQAARVRRQASELIVRSLVGDLAITDEVCALRGCQEGLAIRAPEDPPRRFGEVVEASSSSSSKNRSSAVYFVSAH